MATTLAKTCAAFIAAGVPADAAREAAEELAEAISGAPGGSILSDYLTPDELADQLGITERHLYERHKVGLAPPRTVIGRTIIYRRAAVLTWLRSLEEGISGTASPA